MLREDVDRRGADAVLKADVVGARWRPVFVLAEEVEVAFESVLRAGWTSPAYPC